MEKEKHFSQEQLAKRWLLSEGTLQNWRSQGNGPIFLKLNNHIIYRQSDIINFENKSLMKSTSEKSKGDEL